MTHITPYFIGEVVYAFGNSHYANMISGATENFEIYSVACGMDCMNPPNAAEGKPLVMQATSVPPSPLNVRLSDLEVNDVDYANAEITWTAPLMGAWDSVKVCIFSVTDSNWRERYK